MPNVHRPRGNSYNWRTGELAYRYHGNYCGPGWSAGKYQPSTISSVPPVDAFDRSCMLHDRAYALHGHNPDSDYLWQADYAFYLANINGDAKQRAAAMLVYYGNLRSHKKNNKAMVKFGQYGRTGEFNPRTGHTTNPADLRLAERERRNKRRIDRDTMKETQSKRVKLEHSNKSESAYSTKTNQTEISAIRSEKSMGGISKLGTLAKGFRKVGKEPTGTNEIVFKKELVLANASATANYCSGFTVSTLDITVLPLAMSYEIVRKLFSLTGTKINDFNDVNSLANPTITTGNVGFINLFYKADADSPAASTEYAIVYTNKWIDIVNGLVSLINSTGVSSALFEYFELVINTPGTYPFIYHRLYCDTMRFTYSSFSWMEIQNLTNDGVSTVDTDANTMPVVFKAFEGTGRGPILKTGSLTNGSTSESQPVFVPANNSTLCQFDDLSGGPNNQAQLKEIPNNHYFCNVKLVTTGGIEYGDMKKFIIKHRIHFPVRNFKQWYYDLAQSGGSGSLGSHSRFLSVFIANPITYAARKGVLQYAGKIVSTYKGVLHASTKFVMPSIAPVIV